MGAACEGRASRASGSPPLQAVRLARGRPIPSMGASRPGEKIWPFRFLPSGPQRYGLPTLNQPATILRKSLIESSGNRFRRTLRCGRKSRQRRGEQKTARPQSPGRSSPLRTRPRNGGLPAATGGRRIGEGAEGFVAFGRAGPTQRPFNVGDPAAALALDPRRYHPSRRVRRPASAASCGPAS